MNFFSRGFSSNPIISKPLVFICPKALFVSKTLIQLWHQLYYSNDI